MSNNSQTQLRDLLESYPKVIKKEQDRESINLMLSHLNSTVTSEQRKRCEALLYEGIRLYELDQNDAAYQKFEECKTVFANGDAWHHQGVINFHASNFKRAFEEFSAAILFFREYASAYRYRALCIILLLEDNGKLYQNSEIEKFAKDNLYTAVNLGDEEAKRALREFYRE